MRSRLFDNLNDVAEPSEEAVLRRLALRRLRERAGYDRCENDARRSILDGRSRFAAEERIVKEEFGKTIGQLFQELL